MTEAVQEILHRIQQLSEADRLLLDDYLAQQEEDAWRAESENARREASAKGIDQAAIDRAVANIRNRRGP
jgi:hypothetical protein